MPSKIPPSTGTADFEALLFNRLPEFCFHLLKLAERGVEFLHELVQLRLPGGGLGINRRGFEYVGGALQVACRLIKLAHRIINFYVVDVFLTGLVKQPPGAVANFHGEGLKIHRSSMQGPDDTVYAILIFG